MFSGIRRDDAAFGSFPNHWERIFKPSPLADVTPNVLRHSFASIANDIGFSEITIAALMGHSKESVTSKYVHSLDATLVIATDAVASYIQGAMKGVVSRQMDQHLSRAAREATLERFLASAAVDTLPVRTVR